MSREVAEACEKINWAGVEEVFVFFFVTFYLHVRGGHLLFESGRKSSLDESG